MHCRHALHQEATDDHRHAAPVARKGMHEFRCRRGGIDAGDALDAAAQRLHVHRTIRADARFFRTDMGIALFAGIEVGGFQQFEVGKPPYLVGGAAQQVVVMHRRVGRDDPVDVGQHGQAVGHQQGIGKRRIRRADGTHQFALVIDFHQAAALAAGCRMHGRVVVLEGRQHIAIGQPKVGMRMRVTAHVVEGRHDRWLKRIAHIQDEAAPGIVVVGEQHAAGRHRVFGVVRAYCLLVGFHRRHHSPEIRRARIRVDHEQEIISLLVAITCPDEQ